MPRQSRRPPQRKMTLARRVRKVRPIDWVFNFKEYADNPAEGRKVVQDSDDEDVIAE